MKETRLAMINDGPLETTVVALPEGYHFRFFQDGDEQIWVKILTLAGEFATKQAATERFQNEFDQVRDHLKERMIFIVTEDNQAVGTAIGWYNEEFKDGCYGRLHWVSIVPEFQGRGLARPLVTKALKIMEEEHRKAYLTTRPRSYKGIKLYLDYGFKPLLTTETCIAGWNLVEELLDVKILT